MIPLAPVLWLGADLGQLTGLFAAAQIMDHPLNRVLAGGQDFARLAPELADAPGRLEAEARE